MSKQKMSLYVAYRIENEEARKQIGMGNTWSEW